MAPLSLSDAAVGQTEETGTRVTVLGGKCALFTCGQVGGACEAACTPGITLPPSPMAPTQGDTDGMSEPQECIRGGLEATGTAGTPSPPFSLSGAPLPAVSNAQHEEPQRCRTSGRRDLLEPAVVAASGCPMSEMKDGTPATFPSELHLSAYPQPSHRTAFCFLPFIKGQRWFVLPCLPVSLDQLRPQPLPTP